MYCPNCKKELNGKFCPECGTPLIEKPIQKGRSSFNLGDANAINGNLNVTNIVSERNKSKEEIVLENENKYRQQCRVYLTDGRISGEECSALDKMGADLGINPARQQQILKDEIETSKTKKSTLDGSSSIILEHFIHRMETYDVRGMLNLYYRMQNIVNGIDEERAKFYYYLLTSIIRPTESIQLYESHKDDNYWLTFWTVLAYKIKGKIEQMDAAKNYLSNWSEYDEENALVLDMATAALDSDWDAAEAFYEALEEKYSSELKIFVSALVSLIHANPDFEKIQFGQNQLIYIDGFFYKWVCRPPFGVLKPDGTLDKNTYALSITKYESEFAAMMLLRATLGWGSTCSREMMSNLPCRILRSGQVEDVIKLLEKAKEYGVSVSVEGIGCDGQKMSDNEIFKHLNFK